MAMIDKPEAARRLARAIASDLSLYNEDKIVKGVESDNLWSELSEEIQEGVQLYQSRVKPELWGLNLYNRALIDILFKSKAHVKSRIW